MKRIKQWWSHRRAKDLWLFAPMAIGLFYIVSAFEATGTNLYDKVNNLTAFVIGLYVIVSVFWVFGFKRD